ncbi:putative ATP-binding protein involved in virulence [Methylobacter tundripaludum]|uniref:Putative ATP-binding protein involved in virulence n=1 Tax=Methylobacter tundripaludum TaxID=173365 RepID=A0A2S6GQ09_9GAMM|nr:AAA family ATPase [Methylobacter tundripaludum]PPK67314.1 putative ATP-binding protein involved in virulence [Methylobacter tundripaludum]
MKINKLELLGFRRFEKHAIEFSNRFTLLIGDNGSGKTTILDALAIAMGDLIFEITGVKANEKSRMSLDDMYHLELTMGQQPLKEILKDTFIVIDGVFSSIPIHWINGRGVKRFYCLSKGDLDNGYDEILSKFDSKQLNLIKKQAEERTNLNILFPIAAYYGTGRLWQQLKSKDKKTIGPGSRFEGYQNCLNPASNQKSFFQWFKTQELAALQKQERRHVLEAVREAIVSMIPDAQRAWWDLVWDELMIETLSVQGKLQTIPFSLLSDGYRNMIGVVADIAYRMATLNPQLEADVIKQTEGIVLIDEIDLHLHPKWQKQVVERLLDTFPKVQFVASSHSPFIIQSLYHREDCLLWDLEKNAPVDVDSKSIEDIAENQQGVEIPQQSQRFLDMEKAAEEYYTVLKQIPPAGEDEKQRLRQRLDELLLPYSDDPAFQAFLKMERLAVEGSRHEAG